MISQNTRAKVFFLLFGLLYAYGFVIFLRHNSSFSFPENAIVQSQQPNASIDYIATIDQWNQATSDQKVVLFVDADCNGWTLPHKNRIDSFANWFQRRYGANVIFIDTSIASDSPTWDPANIDIGLFDLLQGLWKTNNVPTGTMKTWGGAGTVAWISDGELVDHTFIGLPDTLDRMRNRTETAFGLQ